MTRFHEHIPVLPERSADLLITDTGGCYVDATLGGGGHSMEILRRLAPDGKLIAFDQDPEALEFARNRIGEENRFEAVEGNFGYLSTLLPPDWKGQVNGIFFDLGVSSHQLKRAERGFSFQQEGPLDMRMGQRTAVTAQQVVNDYSYKQLRDLIFHYGEERHSRQIAKSIIERRPIATTLDLREAILDAVPGRFRIKSLARVFQAIRIEVNRELDMLKTALSESLDWLVEDGRLVAISYHSLEDRIVKTFFRSGNHEGKIKKDFYGNELSPLSPITRKPISPTREEIDKNPAARSARLRAARKIVVEA